MSLVQHHRGFLSINGPVAIDVEVARYYDQHPLQLAHDFPEVPQRQLWRHIGRVLDAAGDESAASPHCGGGLADTVDAAQELNATGRLPDQTRRHWAEREAERLLRARQLRLPEAHPVPLASDGEVRRARLKPV